MKQDRGEGSGSFGEHVAAGAVARKDNVSPPLVRDFVRRHEERGVQFVRVAREESDALRERDVRREALGLAL